MPSHYSKYGNFFKFGRDDIFHNRIKVLPKVEFFIYSRSVYYNNENQTAINSHTPQGHINLYELNVHRDLHPNDASKEMIYPFITKGGSFTSFKTISADKFNHDFSFGDILSGSYPLTSTISIDRYDASFVGEKKKRLYALKSTLDFHSKLSPHYAYSSPLGNKEDQIINLISIPSIFFGSSIDKGSVKLKYYITGSLLAEACDTLKNGQLIQTTGSTVGQTVGVVLYNEGFIMLTSSAALSGVTEKYLPNNSNELPASWQYFGATGSADYPSSSFGIEFNGVNYIETVTMFAHAKEGELNFSNNPTFISGTYAASSASQIYIEDPKTNIKNILSSSYPEYSASYKPVTYISKVGIYDKNKNLIAVAGLAKPVRKLEERSYTFKLKLDI